MSPEARFDRVLDSYAWVEYFRGTEAGRAVAEELETALVGTPLVVLAELRDKYVRERVPDWPRDLAFIKEATALLAEDERIAVRAGETKNRMRDQGRKDFGLIDGIIYETARAVDAILVTGDPHFRDVRGVRFLE
ncbi:MAG: PIN domain-containing protein [Candidatus Thermoplasmatota archaeon]